MKYGILILTSLAMILLSGCASMTTSASISDATSETFDATSGTTSTGGDIVTSASTSGKGSSGVKDDVYIDKIEAYIKANGENVKKEIAAGDGQHLDAIAAILEIKKTAPFKAKLQKNFDKIYTAETLADGIVARRIFKLK